MAVAQSFIEIDSGSKCDHFGHYIKKATSQEPNFLRAKAQKSSAYIEIRKSQITFDRDMLAQNKAHQVDPDEKQDQTLSFVSEFVTMMSADV